MGEPQEAIELESLGYTSQLAICGEIDFLLSGVDGPVAYISESKLLTIETSDLSYGDTTQTVTV